MPRRQTAEKGAAQRPSQLTFEPMPLHAVGRWSCEQTRVEAVEQLLFGSVRTGRPLLVCSAFEADVRVALEAQAKAQQLLGECAEEVPEDGPAATLPFAVRPAFDQPSSMSSSVRTFLARIVVQFPCQQVFRSSLLKVLYHLRSYFMRSERC